MQKSFACETDFIEFFFFFTPLGQVNILVIL